MVANSEISLYISVARQQLSILNKESCIRTFAVSTAKNGVGELYGSECTPRGWHYIRARIGDGCDINSVFVGRRPTGEIFSPELKQKNPERDWILTRILWLCGLEPGFNRLGNVDTMRRYIYIHGCPEEDDFSAPGSHGCIKLKNKDMIDLFNLVHIGTRILITE